MKVEVLKESGRTGGVSTWTVTRVIEGLNLLAKRRAVSDGAMVHQSVIYELTTIGKLEEGNRVRITELVRDRRGATKKGMHYKVVFDMTGQSRMGKYELERVPVE